MIVTRRQFHNHLTSDGIANLIALLNRLEHFQKVAASGTGDLGMVRQDGAIRSLYLISTAIADEAAGETLTIDVLVNGVSVLTAPYVYDYTKPVGKQIELPVSGSKKNVKCGDIVTVTRTLANGTTLTGTLVALEAA